MTLQDKLNIIQNQFHLEIEEIEPTVYKVINTNQEVNIDKLQWALEECILITSTKRGRERLKNGVSTIISNVYYIIIAHDIDVALKYEKKSLKNHTDTTLIEYKYSENNTETIDTLYKVEVE